ncbi:uncharacterized protein J3D65DRAFT_373864 [Phyllosticta citribraziliensis]|uniref:Core Histone H2A/H2B/H3 domain-containing protein n=1 Tax=Phyllosticta citribraziliensis TaxID=989973 RepID=A0ABR1LRF2_9PEZI
MIESGTLGALLLGSWSDIMLRGVWGNEGRCQHFGIEPFWKREHRRTISGRGAPRHDRPLRWSRFRWSAFSCRPVCSLGQPNEILPNLGRGFVAGKGSGDVNFAPAPNNFRPGRTRGGGWRRRKDWWGPRKPISRLVSGPPSDPQCLTLPPRSSQNLANTVSQSSIDRCQLVQLLEPAGRLTLYIRLPGRTTARQCRGAPRAPPDVREPTQRLLHWSLKSYGGGELRRISQTLLAVVASIFTYLALVKDAPSKRSCVESRVRHSILGLGCAAKLLKTPLLDLRKELAGYISRKSPSSPFCFPFDTALFVYTSIFTYFPPYIDPHDHSRRPSKFLFESSGAGVGSASRNTPATNLSLTLNLSIKNQQQAAQCRGTLKTLDCKVDEHDDVEPEDPGLDLAPGAPPLLSPNDSHVDHLLLSSRIYRPARYALNEDGESELRASGAMPLHQPCPGSVHRSGRVHQRWCCPRHANGVKQEPRQTGVELSLPTILPFVYTFVVIARKIALPFNWCFVNSADLLLTKVPFVCLVHEVSSNVTAPALSQITPWQSKALEAPQEAAEAYMVGLMEDTNYCAQHARRQTIKRVGKRSSRTMLPETSKWCEARRS